MPIADELLLTEQQREWWLWLRWLSVTGRVTEMAGVSQADMPRPMVLPRKCISCALRRDTASRSYCAADGRTIERGRQGTEDESLKDACKSWAGNRT